MRICLNHLVFYDNGNVGIGTMSPTTGKLVVSGGNVDVTTNKIINLNTPTASSDAATKGYVDAQVGGGGIRYWEITQTTTLYTGDLGGFTGANDKCVQEFGQGSVMFNSAILTSAFKGGAPIVLKVPSPPSTGYFQKLGVSQSTAFGQYESSDFWGGSNSGINNCFAWTFGGGGGVTGTRIDVNGVTTFSSACSGQIPIICATPK